jgi:hypothetical protein
MQSMCTTSRIPNRDPKGIEVPRSCVPPPSVANKDAWSAERPQGAFTVIRNPWEKRYLQSLEYLLPQTKNAQGTALLRRVRSC